MSSQPSPEARHVVIMGLMGSGKTTLATQLADRLGWHYSDSDREIEDRTGLTGGQFAEAYGVQALHLIEAALVLMALGADTSSVITPAASTIENVLVREMIESRAVGAYLDVPVAELERRHATGSHRRNLAAGELQAQHERRRPLFTETAELTLPHDLPTAEALTVVTVLAGRLKSD